MDKNRERPHLAPGYPAGLPEPTAQNDPHPFLDEMPVAEEEQAQRKLEQKPPQNPKRT